MVDSNKMLQPSGLLCNLFRKPDKVLFLSRDIQFCWTVNSLDKGGIQTAYRILVSSTIKKLKSDDGDYWDSGKVLTSDSSSIPYNGKKLCSNQKYYWKVKVWDNLGQESKFSNIQKFMMGELSNDYKILRYPLERTKILPSYIRNKNGRCFIDFGKAVFGTVRLKLSSPIDGFTISVHLGEVVRKLRKEVESEPGGYRRFQSIQIKLKKGLHFYTVKIKPDKKNTGPKAVKMPRGFGEVMPFRYCEIINCPHTINRTMVEQIGVNYPFDYNASKFISSNKALNDVWELCKYSVKATSFCGVYVDGDRERVPYEGDAYINQLSHYYVDKEYNIGRYTLEYLIKNATWPMEFPMYTIFMAWNDYMFTNDQRFIKFNYDNLLNKTLFFLRNDNSLISANSKDFPSNYKKLINYYGTRQIEPLVDWPHPGFAGSQGETDNFDFKPVNAVINAFHYRSVVLMSKIACILNKKLDETKFLDTAQKIKKHFNFAFLNKRTGIYRDGIGSEHSSLHANMYALAFGLVSKKNISKVVEFIKSRGMACSVYGAQHLLEALYNAEEADYTLNLLTSKGKRSWINMIKSGSTITTEAWDNECKPNQDWNHAWGSAPANIIPRFVMGIEPLEPGFSKIQIKPQSSILKWANAEISTIKGKVYVDLRKTKDTFRLNVIIPFNTVANIFLPTFSTCLSYVTINGIQRKVSCKEKFLPIYNVGSGRHTFEIKL